MGVFKRCCKWLVEKMKAEYRALGTLSVVALSNWFLTSTNPVLYIVLTISSSIPLIQDECNRLIKKCREYTKRMDIDSAEDHEKTLHVYLSAGIGYITGIGCFVIYGYQSFRSLSTTGNLETTLLSIIGPTSTFLFRLAHNAVMEYKMKDKPTMQTTLSDRYKGECLEIFHPITNFIGNRRSMEIPLEDPSQNNDKIGKLLETLYYNDYKYFNELFKGHKCRVKTSQARTLQTELEQRINDQEEESNSLLSLPPQLEKPQPILSTKPLTMHPSSSSSGRTLTKNIFVENDKKEVEMCAIGNEQRASSHQLTMDFDKRTTQKLSTPDKRSLDTNDKLQTAHDEKKTRDVSIFVTENGEIAGEASAFMSQGSNNQTDFSRKFKKKKKNRN